MKNKILESALTNLKSIEGLDVVYAFKNEYLMKRFHDNFRGTSIYDKKYYTPIERVPETSKQVPFGKRKLPFKSVFKKEFSDTHNEYQSILDISTLVPISATIVSSYFMAKAFNPKFTQLLNKNNKGAWVFERINTSIQVHNQKQYNFNLYLGDIHIQDHLELTEDTLSYMYEKSVLIGKLMFHIYPEKDGAWSAKRFDKTTYQILLETVIVKINKALLEEALDCLKKTQIPAKTFFNEENILQGLYCHHNAIVLLHTILKQNNTYHAIHNPHTAPIKDEAFRLLSILQKNLKYLLELKFQNTIAYQEESIVYRSLLLVAYSNSGIDLERVLKVTKDNNKLEIDFPFLLASLAYTKKTVFELLPELTITKDYYAISNIKDARYDSMKLFDYDYKEDFAYYLSCKERTITKRHLPKPKDFLNDSAQCTVTISQQMVMEFLLNQFEKFLNIQLTKITNNQEYIFEIEKHIPFKDTKQRIEFKDYFSYTNITLKGKLLLSFNTEQGICEIQLDAIKGVNEHTFIPIHFELHSKIGRENILFNYVRKDANNTSQFAEDFYTSLQSIFNKPQINPTNNEKEIENLIKMNLYQSKHQGIYFGDDIIPYKTDFNKERHLYIDFKIND